MQPRTCPACLINCLMTNCWLAGPSLVCCGREVATNPIHQSTEKDLASPALHKHACDKTAAVCCHTGCCPLLAQCFTQPRSRSSAVQPSRSAETRSSAQCSPAIHSFPAEPHAPGQNLNIKELQCCRCCINIVDTPVQRYRGYREYSFNYTKLSGDKIKLSIRMDVE